jgi:S1-C subfamily serine protease
VPVSELNRMVPEIIRSGRVVRPGLGVSLANPDLSRRLDIEGVLIIEVQPASSADKAGLRGTTQTQEGVILGDIIVAVNDKKVSDYNELRDELERYQVGESVTLTILRDGVEARLPVPLEAME